MSVQHFYSVFGHRNIRICLVIWNETTVFSGLCSDTMHLVCFRCEFSQSHWLCLNLQPSDFTLSTEAAVKDECLNCDGGAGSCYSRTKDWVSLSLSPYQQYPAHCSSVTPERKHSRSVMGKCSQRKRRALPLQISFCLRTLNWAPLWKPRC